jgi:hypothetical protein
VSVSVNQARHHERAFGIDYFPGLISHRQIARRPDFHNAVALNRHRAISQHSPLRVHSHNQPVRHQEINMLSRALSQRAYANTNHEGRANNAPDPHAESLAYWSGAGRGAYKKEPVDDGRTWCFSTTPREATQWQLYWQINNLALWQADCNTHRR